MKDIQNQRDHRKIPIDKVGIKNLRYPITVLDRKKGYFPLPALKYVRGEFLDFMKSILLTDTARQRGLFNPAYIEKLLKKPESYLTRLQGSKLWHLALLELWLQTNVDR